MRFIFFWYCTVSMSSLAEYTLKQVATHKKPSDLWMVIHGKVYNVTSFRDDHPGGGDLLDDEAGKYPSSFTPPYSHSNRSIPFYIISRY